MQSLVDNLVLLLTTPPGNLAYYLVLAFSIVGALQGAISSISPNPAPRLRMLVGLSFLLLIQIGLFIAAGFAWQGALPLPIALPIVDRAVALLCIVLFIWLWAFLLPSRGGDIFMFVIAAVVIASLVIAGMWWSEQPLDTPFNSSLADSTLNAVALGVLFIGTLILLIRRPLNWGLGLAMLILLAIGHGLNLVWSTPIGDYSGWLRITQLAAFPWLLALPRSLENELTNLPSAPIARSVVPERKRYNLQPALIQDLLTILREPENPDFGNSLVRIVAQLMLADFCMLLVPSNGDNQIVVAQAYNLIEEKYLEGFSIDSRLLPGVDSALRRGRILRLPSGSASSDLTVLAQRMHLSRVGHLMLVPVVAPGNETRMAILLISPYSNRSWAADDQIFLGQISASIAAFMPGKQEFKISQDEPTDYFPASDRSNLADMQPQQDNNLLQNQIQELRRQVAEERSRAESLAALIESQRVGTESGSQESNSNQDFILENDLRLALLQIADLKQALAEADQKLLAAQSPLFSMPVGQQDREDLISLVEELRQPLASVMGNADLLLGESMGILGAFQKKFVERIRASGERMVVLFDDLIQMVSLAGSGEALTPQPIDLNAIIDSAIEVAMVPLRDKNLTLRVDIPADLPAFHADPNSVQRILTNLLQNAGTCTPPEGSISLQARAEIPEHEPGFILIQVSDSGGGIASQDLPLIFAQNLKTDSPKIAGLGTPPEPFSMTKALVEAHGGRIWVDSIAGRGAMFSALFPIANEGLSVH